LLRKIRADKLTILEFIMKRSLVWPYELREKFGYSDESAYVTLSRLKKAGLIINMTKGCWELTEEGYRKLKYYGRR